MELTKRQEKVLNAIIDEYIKSAEPVSSKSLAKRKGFNVCPATIRNEMQELADLGYIYQPHTSAGRVPTKKAYHYFIDIIFEDKERLFSSVVFKEIEITKQQIEKELELAGKLIRSLEEMSSTFNLRDMPEKDNLFEILAKLGPSRMTCDNNIALMRELLKSMEDF